jgi:Flp pilus assembly protein TadD
LAVGADPGSAESHNNLGVALHQDGDLDGAVSEFHKAVSADPKFADGLKNLGQALRDKGDYAAAVQAYRQLVALQPDSAPAHAILGYTLRWNDQLKEAVEELQAAIRINPKSGRPHFHLAEVLDQLGNTDQTLQEYQTAAHLSPDDPEVRSRYGAALVKTRPQDAVIELRRALLIDPKNPNIHQTVAMALRRTGDIPGATAEFKLAQEETDQDNKHTAAVRDTNSGIAFLKKGNVKDAIKELRAALASEPDFAEANHYLGIALSADREWKEANEAFETALHVHPSNPEIHYNYGTSLSRQANWQGALREYRTAITLRPSHPTAHCALADALAHLGDPTESQSELTLAGEYGACQLAGSRWQFNVIAPSLPRQMAA